MNCANGAYKWCENSYIRRVRQTVAKLKPVSENYIFEDCGFLYLRSAEVNNMDQFRTTRAQLLYYYYSYYWKYI